MAATQYYDFKVCSFAKFDIWSSLRKLNINQETRNELLNFNKKIKENIKKQNENIRFPCRMSVTYIKNVVHKIFPMGLFGCRYNFVKFFNIIKKICTATFYENVSYKSLIKGWRLNDIHWLFNVTEPNKKEILIQVIIWLTNIFKTKILKKLFYLQSELKSNEINYIPINIYRSFYTKSINEMISKNQLIQTESKRVNCVTKLRIFPRALMTSHRPIIRTRLLRSLNKWKIKPLLKNKGALFNRNMYEAWSNFVKTTKDEPIYGIKVDVKDAFSNVDIGNIVKVSYTILLHKEYCVTEKLKPLLKKFLKNQPFLDDILKSLDKQVVRVGRYRYFYWNRGLMQGMKLSAKLCDLSRAFFDRTFLQSFINKEDFFFRTIDDYFFCSTDKDKVLRFKQIILSRETISQEKTKTNIINDIKILFNGRLFNLRTKEIEIHIDSELQTFRCKSKLLYKKINTTDPYKYLRDIGSLKTNSYNFDKLLLNLNFNSRETVLQNYFKAMIIVSFKIDCAIKERLEEVPSDLHLYIEKLVRYYVVHVRKKLVQTKIYKDQTMYLRRNILKCIGIKAFIVVLQKRYLSYEDCIIYLKNVAKNIKHHMIGTKFNKLPEEFKNIKMKRVLMKYT